MNLTLRRPSLGTLLGGLALFVAGTGAAGAAGAFVTIQDPTTSSNARVSSSGKLYVGDGSGPVDVVGGPALPKDVIRGYTEFFDSTCRIVYTPPAGKAAVIETMTTATYQSADPRAAYRFFVALPGAPCDGSSFVSILSSTDNSTHTLGSGLVIPAGRVLGANEYLYLSAPASRGVVSFTGYTIPAASAPAVAAVPSTPGPDGSATGE